ncbi:hypothetical protein RvY_04839 [Ramazzottius varieornatus]|uniref:Reverse transcriptase domain-containing protein n=1 Tax=Ramazzottius varieornatus TaxID=947166 RepID=A0A1D1UWH9_RAMVA|nr:hypothetical protein RvY_04839 [Ramazzottius varieornatus]
MVHQWSQALSEKNLVDEVFLDCTKAFDRVPHEVLYADDLVAHRVIDKTEDCQAFQECLDQLGDNYIIAGLSLNSDKSQHLRLSFKRSGSVPVPQVWNPTNQNHQKQLERVQKDFLESIRLSKIPKGQHDSDFNQYRQHLAEVQWDNLWMSRAKAVLISAFKIWTDGFPEGHLLLSGPSTTQQQISRVTTRSQNPARVPDGKDLRKELRSLLSVCRDTLTIGMSRQRKLSAEDLRHHQINRLWALDNAKKGNVAPTPLGKADQPTGPGQTKNFCDSISPHDELFMSQTVD